MFHYNLFIVLTIAANVLTNPIVNPPARCCPPDRYSHKIDHSYHHKYFDGTSSTVHVQSFNVYDAERGFVVRRGTMKTNQNNFEDSFWSIYNLKTKDYYEIYAAQNICVKTPNIAYGDPCISPMATYANSSTFTHDGKETLVDTWIIQDNYSVSYQKVRRDDCLQIESGYNMPHDGSSSITKYYDILKDIADPTIFQIPSSCH